MAIKRLNDLQLKFDLDLDEVVEDAEERAISPEEARQISEAARQAMEEQASPTLEIGGELGHPRRGPEWWDDYLKLRESGWPWRVATYIAWASSPKTLRKPKTLEELATTVLGLTSPRVIYTWRRKHPTIDTVVMMMQAAPLWEHRRDVLEALIEMAKKPDYKSHNDRKLFLEMIGDYTPKNLVGLGKAVSGDDLSEMSEEELRALIPDQDAEGEQPEIEEERDAG